MDIDIPILDTHGKSINIPPLKKETSETDLYLNLLANPNKSRVDSVKSSSSFNYDNDDKKSETSSVRKTSRRRGTEQKHSYSERRRSTESSKAQYEDVDVSDRRTHTNTHSEVEETPAPKLTGQQLRMKKIDLLRKLSDLKAKGFKLTKEYDFNSSIEEMEYEYDLLKSFADRRAGIKLYKNTIINFTNLVEFFNDKYDPFGAELGGWAEHMSVEVDSYDDVLEELYEKYKGAGKSLPAEVKLLILIGFSGSAFHFSKKHMSSMQSGGGGGIASGLQSSIAQKIASMGKEKSKFMSEQELNIERQKAEMNERDKMMKQNMFNHTNAKAPVNFGQPMQMPSFSPGGPPSLLINNKDPRGNSLNVAPQREPLIANESVKDVLKRLHNREVDSIDTQDESTVNNDRLLSDTTASDSKKKGKKKKLMMNVM
jgi:hypothetical protein